MSGGSGSRGHTLRYSKVSIPSLPMFLKYFCNHCGLEHLLLYLVSKFIYIFFVLFLYLVGSESFDSLIFYFLFFIFCLLEVLTYVFCGSFFAISKTI